MNVIGWLEFELADYNVTVQNLNCYATGTFPNIVWFELEGVQFKFTNQLHHQG